MIKTPSFSDGVFLWTKISGKWNVDLSSHTLCSSRVSTNTYGYSDLIDNNSVTSIPEINRFTDIECGFELHSPVDDNHFTLIFSSSHYGLNFYGIRFNGTKEKLNRISLIQSKPINKDLSSKEKNNFVIENLISSDLALSYNSPIVLKLKINKSKLKVYVNDKVAIDYPLNEKVQAGKIGFSHKNNLVQVKTIYVRNGKEIIFTDDFSRNTVKTYTVTAEKVRDSK